MSDMIERVARALHDMHGAGPAYELAADDWRDMARAAIEAMREPTQKMRLAGIAEYSRPDPTPEHESTLIFNAVWRAMADAALLSKVDA